MKYALLVHQPNEVFERRDDKVAIAAGRASGEAPNLDAALEWAARHPAAGFAFIEVRPILGFGVAPAKAA